MRISSSKPVHSIKSISKVNKVYKSNTVSFVTNIHKIRVYNASESLINMNEPDLFPIPKDEKEKFINDALYKDENRLLQVIMNTIHQTTIGKEIYPFILAFAQSKQIYFVDSSDKLGAYASFQINSMDKNDIEIVIAKDNCIPFLAASLVHEISHYIDYRGLFYDSNKCFTSFETETKAFANSHRFLTEGEHTKSFWYFMLSKKRIKLLEDSYDYVYNRKLVLKSNLYTDLSDIGYDGLDDKISLDLIFKS